jgi:DNA-binding protein HU-beta
MNKSDIIAIVASTSDLSKADAEKAVDATFYEIQKALATGDDVRLIGFGSFSVTPRAASTGRNPRTGEPIEIAASKQPKFSAGKALKDALNN